MAVEEADRRDDLVRFGAMFSDSPPEGPTYREAFIDSLTVPEEV
jgi:hypothetical protein